jgi:hypothetical protein
MKGFERDLQAISASSPVKVHLYPCLESHTPRALLEKFPFLSKNCANTCHCGENHDGQPRKADQATNLENLRYSAEFSPIGHHRHLSFPTCWAFAWSLL